MPNLTPDKVPRRSGAGLLKRNHNTTYNYAFPKKKKLAPRSSLQFKIGPPFAPTRHVRPVFNSLGRVVEPVLNPRIDRGFEVLYNEWVGYKRNYFTLVSTFLFDGVPFGAFAGDEYFVQNEERNTLVKRKIQYFGIRILAKSLDDDTIVNLVQHTAKRDRGPQFSPKVQIVVPGTLPGHAVIKEAANVRNLGKIAKLNEIFFFDRDKHKDSYSISGLDSYPEDKIMKVARFERVQFSLSINYKKPSLSSKRFKLVFELVGFLNDKDFVVLTYRETPPLIIRGRSPSNYSGSSAPQRSVKEPVESDATYDSGMQLQSFPTDDYETFEILREANDQMSLENELDDASLNKKRRGRKPKSTNSARKQEITPMSVKDTEVKAKGFPSKDILCYSECMPSQNILSEISGNIMGQGHINQSYSTWDRAMDSFSHLPSVFSMNCSNERLRLSEVQSYEPELYNSSHCSLGLDDLFDGQHETVDNPHGQRITFPMSTEDENEYGPPMKIIRDQIDPDLLLDNDLELMKEMGVKLDEHEPFDNSSHQFEEFIYTKSHVYAGKGEMQNCDELRRFPSFLDE